MKTACHRTRPRNRSPRMNAVPTRRRVAHFLLASLLLAALAWLPGKLKADEATNVHVISTRAGATLPESAGHDIDLQSVLLQLRQGAGNTTAHPPSSRGQIMARRGETLAQVIRRSHPQTPLKEELIRQAYERLNPEAAAGSRYRGLRNDTRLTVPSAEDLRQAALTRYPESADLFVPASPSHAPALKPEPVSGGDGGERKRWVRFPG